LFPYTTLFRSEQSRAAEEHVLNPGDRHDVELHRLLEHPHLARVDTQRVARLQVVDDDLAVQSHPRLALPGQLLETKAGPSENARAQALLETDRELDAKGRAQEAVPVNHVTRSGRDLHGEDLTRELRREGKESRTSDGRVLRHEKRAAGERAPEGAHKPTLLASHRRAGLHLDRH